jgi:hypothetical protein
MPRAALIGLTYRKTVLPKAMVQCFPVMREISKLFVSVQKEHTAERIDFG